MQYTMEKVKEFRQRYGVGLKEIADALKTATTETQAVEILKTKGHAMVDRRAARLTKVGKLASYVHHNGKYASLVELRCETDFVANSDAFKVVHLDVCMHVAAVKSIVNVMGVPFIKDESKSIKDLLDELSAKTGEKIEIGFMTRHEIV